MIMKTEEKLLAELSAAYSNNTLYSQIIIPKVFEHPLLELITSCGAAGFVHRLMQRDILTGASDEFAYAVAGLAKACRAKYSECEHQLCDILQAASRQGVRCVVGGDFALLSDYLGNGDLNIFDIRLYTDRPLVLTEARIPVFQSHLPKVFFDRYYSASIKVNKAPINILCSEEYNKLQKDKFNRHLIRFYFLQCLCRDLVNINAFTGEYFTSCDMLDSFFAQKSLSACATL